MVSWQACRPWSWMDVCKPSASCARLRLGAFRPIAFLGKSFLRFIVRMPEVIPYVL